jgi:hypothetical protein
MMLLAWVEDSWNWRPLFNKQRSFNHRLVDARWLCFGIQYEWSPYRIEFSEVTIDEAKAAEEAKGETHG